MLTRPERNEYSDWYADYVARVPDGDVIEVLERQSQRDTGVSEGRCRRSRRRNRRRRASGASSR